MLITQIAVFLQRLADDAFHLPGQVRIEPDRRRGQPFQNCIEDQRRSVPAKREGSGRHLIQHRAKRKQIAARIEFLAFGLLGRHVSHGPHGRSGTGQVVFAHGGRLREHSRRVHAAAADRSDLGQSEVQHLGMTALGDENVGGLDVAVNDALGMRGVERIGNLDREREQRVHLQRTPGDHVLQSHAVQIFHGDERLAILLADVVNGADVGMVQRRSRLRLALKAAECLGILGHFIGQKLECDKTMQPRVFRFVNHTHPAAAKLVDNAVMRNGLADHGFANPKAGERRCGCHVR